MTSSVSERLLTLRRLLSVGKNSTQEELRDDLEELGFDVNQSTISRDLRKIAAIKTIDQKGRTVYRLTEASSEKNLGGSIPELILSIEHNDSILLFKQLQARLHLWPAILIWQNLRGFLEPSQGTTRSSLLLSKLKTSP